MTWNPDLTKAPPDAPIWLASACGKVIKSEWIPETKHSGGRWAGVGAPIAWQEYVVPVHPGTVARPTSIDTGTVHFMSACDGVGGV